MSKATKEHIKRNSSLSGQKNGAKKIIYPVKHIWGLVIAAVAFLLYTNTIGHDYALDDSGAITGNLYVQEGLSGISKLMRVEFWHFSNMHLGYYRPLALITFAIEHQFFHGNPHISHLVNCLIFALSGYLLFIVLNKVFNSYNALFSFAIALLFIAHPIHTEIVANIKGRDELLSFFNVVLMLWFALKYIDTKKVVFLIASLLFCYLGMLSKETALTGVLLLPVFIFYYKDFTILECIKKSLPFIVVVILFFIQKKMLLGTLSGIIPSDIVNYPYTKGNVKLPTTFMLFAFCIRLLIIPHPLRYDYSYNQIPAVHMSDGLAWLGIILFAAGAYFTVKQALKKTTWGLALSIFYITLIPALAFTVLRGGIFAERFLFFPSLGFCIALVYGAVLVIKSDVLSAVLPIKEWLKMNTKLVVLLGVVFTLYSVKTVSRNKAWKDNFTLFSEDIKTGKNSAQNQNHYGNQYIYLASVEKDSAKKIEYVTKGINALKQSLRVHPKFGESYYLIGLAYQIIKPNTDSAIYYYNKAIETAPGYSDSYYHLGILYQNIGKNNVASYYYNEAVKYNPQYEEPKKASEALKAMGVDVYINPLTSTADSTSTNKDTKYYYELGNYYASQGNYSAAASNFQKAVALDDNNENAYINLVNSYGMMKHFDKALEISNKILAKNPKSIFALKNIAVVYNALGNKEKAEEYMEKLREVENK
jgi:tetratricopeptide (TPR) repeat protein